MTAPYYADESVTLYLGDCREVTEWLAADVLVTDPPYGIGWSIGLNKAAGSKAHAGILNDNDTACRDWVLDAFGDRPGVVFGTWAAPFPDYRQVLVWRKPVDAGVVGSTTGYRRDTELIFLTGNWPRRTSSRSSVLLSSGGKGLYLNGHPHAKPTASRSPWLVGDGGQCWNAIVADDDEQAVASTWAPIDIPEHDYSREEGNAKHIASWDPAVALAVATWLQAMATPDPLNVLAGAQRHALAVASAYLREAS